MICPDFPECFCSRIEFYYFHKGQHFQLGYFGHLFYLVVPVSMVIKKKRNPQALKGQTNLHTKTL